MLENYKKNITLKGGEQHVIELNSTINMQKSHT